MLKRRFVPKPKPNPHFMPLVCVYQPHKKVRDVKGNVLRDVFTGPMCCAVADRSRIDPDRPMYPNRFDEPLCALHAKHKNDTFAFPDDVKDPSAWRFGGIFLSEEEIDRQQKENRRLAGKP